MAEWLQGATGLWMLVDGDVLLKGPQAAPDNDGLPRRYSAGFAHTGEGMGIERAMALLGQIAEETGIGSGGAGGVFGRREWPDWVPQWLAQILDSIAKWWDDLKREVEKMKDEAKSALLFALIGLSVVLIVTRR